MTFKSALLRLAPLDVTQKASPCICTQSCEIRFSRLSGGGMHCGIVRFRSSFAKDSEPTLDVSTLSAAVVLLRTSSLSAAPSDPMLFRVSSRKALLAPLKSVPFCADIVSCHGAKSTLTSSRWSLRFCLVLYSTAAPPHPKNGPIHSSPADRLINSRPRSIVDLSVIPREGGNRSPGGVHKLICRQIVNRCLFWDNEVGRLLIYT